MNILDELPMKESLRLSLLTSERREIKVGRRCYSIANLKTFAVHGCRCVRCGCEGNKIVAWVDIGGGLHIDLFAEGYVLMNRDHIIPRSKKGPNSDWNYQTMCHKCNNKKGNNETPADVKLSKFRGHWKKVHLCLHDGYWNCVPRFLRSRWLTKKSVRFRDAHLHKVSFWIAKVTSFVA